MRHNIFRELRDLQLRVEVVNSLISGKDLLQEIEQEQYKEIVEKYVVYCRDYKSYSNRGCLLIIIIRILVYPLVSTVTFISSLARELIKYFRKQKLKNRKTKISRVVNLEDKNKTLDALFAELELLNDKIRKLKRKRNRDVLLGALVAIFTAILAGLLIEIILPRLQSIFPNVFLLNK